MSDQPAAPAPAPAPTPTAATAPTAPATTTGNTAPVAPAGSPGEPAHREPAPLPLAPEERARLEARRAAMEQCYQEAEAAVDKELADYASKGYVQALEKFEQKTRRLRKLRPLGYFSFFFIWSAISSQLILGEDKLLAGLVIIDILVGFAGASSVLVYMMLMLGPDRPPPTPEQRQARRIDDLRSRYSSLLQKKKLI